jgi:4-hydroxyphenylpyruvate dioxygenase-like putative hemolysin
MLDVYRAAYTKIIADAGFIDRGRKMSDDFEPWQSGEVELLINTLGQTPPEAIDQISVMLHRQGLQGQ